MSETDRESCVVSVAFCLLHEGFITHHTHKSPGDIHHMAITVWGINVAAKLPVYLAKKGIQLRIVICDCCPLKKKQ